MTNGIIARIVADSITSEGSRITTFELEYPRIIHSELMTHRLLSRNAMSSRAIPIKKMIEQVQQDPAMPVKFGKNQPGMQDAGEHDELIGAGYSAKAWWKLAALSAAKFAEGFAEAGYHKQVGNRLLEPFQRMKTVVTATDWNNFFWLRVDKDADPTIYEAASVMKKAYDESDPELLKPGQWHTPYVDHIYGLEPGSGDFDTPVFEGYCVLDENNKPVKLTVEEAKAISASCCAQVSYRVLNNTKDKALDIYAKLLSGNKVHASPFEHQATPMEHHNQLVRIQWFLSKAEITQDTETWEPGVTHVDRNGLFWSGNLRGWVQHRQLVPNNVVSG